MLNSLTVVVVPIAAILACLSITAIVLVPKAQRSSFIVAGAVCLAAAIAGSVIAIWMYEFGQGLDKVPQSVDDSQAFGLVTAGLAFLALLATGALATLRRRKSR